jgi:hypothetical protein
MVEGKRYFSVPAFIAWLVLGLGWGALVYLIYYACKAQDKCPVCRSTTLSSPPPGYVLNPNVAATYVPQEVVHQQQRLHQQQALFVAPPPRAEVTGAQASPSAGPALPAGESWANVSVPSTTTCPGCKTPFAVESRRPLDVRCPACGTTGTLPLLAAALAYVAGRAGIVKLVARRHGVQDAAVTSVK